MFVQIIKFQSSLDFDEVLEISKKRASEFKEIPGIIQKYYTQTADKSGYAGIYVWDSEKSLQEFRESKLAASIPEAYHLSGPPEIEVYEVAFSLRN